jgi:hypothetical protein
MGCFQPLVSLSWICNLWDRFRKQLTATFLIWCPANHLNISTMAENDRVFVSEKEQTGFYGSFYDFMRWFCREFFL